MYISRRSSSLEGGTRQPTGVDQYECRACYEGGGGSKTLARLDVRRAGSGAVAWQLRPLQEVAVRVSCISGAWRNLDLEWLPGQALPEEAVSAGEGARSGLALFMESLEAGAVGGENAGDDRGVLIQTASLAPAGDNTLQTLLGALSAARSRRGLSETVAPTPHWSHRLYNSAAATEALPPSVPSSVRAEGREGAKLLRLLEQTRPLRHTLRGCVGRIAFGRGDQVRPAFAAQSAEHGVDFERQQGGRDAAAQAALTVGHAGARVRMEGWGEVWAEEEDLPGETAGEAGEAGGGSGGAKGAGSLVGRYYKEVALSSQRINKVKVAKSKSKYSA